jgi:aromatic-L-amino-acid/L-tryptophan decarboxylase
MYSAMINCIGFNWQTSPACTELETIVLDWMAKAICLDPSYFSSGEGGAVIQGSASESVLVALIAARQRMVDLKRDEIDIYTKLIAYGSTQTHSCTKKAALVAGVKFRALDVKSDFELEGDTLDEAIQSDIDKGLIPFFVTATIGTTSSAATDDIVGITQFANKAGIWVHIDAAWWVGANHRRVSHSYTFHFRAGAALVCPEHQHYLKGTENADSFSFNMHKWLLTNFDCSPIW